MIKRAILDANDDDTMTLTLEGTEPQDNFVILVPMSFEIFVAGIAPDNPAMTTLIETEPVIIPSGLNFGS